MSGDEFYEAFKDALKYVGLRFGEMNNADIELVGNEIRVTFDGRTAGILIIRKDEVK